MKKYEIMFIVNVADEEVIKSAVELVKNTIGKIGGTIDRKMNGASVSWLTK